MRSCFYSSFLLFEDRYISSICVFLELYGNTFFALETVSHQPYKLNRQLREQKNAHKAFTIWLTGLSGSGKSTIANAVEQLLFAQGIQCFVLDGDNVRMGLNRDLDFSREGRQENIRRISEVAKLFNDAGVVLITAFISPYHTDRALAKDIIGAQNYFEVYLDASVACCMQRDVKGLYKKAQQGLIENFTGVNDIYEVPASPALHLHTDTETVEESVNRLILQLKQNKLIAG